MRAVLALLASAGLLAVCAVQQPSGCDFSDSGGLSRCIEQLLINSRDKIAKKADPLRLPDQDEGDLEISNIVIRGIAGYSVDNLFVTFPRDQQIAVRATISWPRIRGDINLKVRKCKRIIFNFCATVRARPNIKVGRTVGTLTTTLNVDVTPDGKLTVRASSTNVSLNLASIRAKANVRGVIGRLNKVFRDPASRIATREANKWWNKNKGKIQNKVKDVLNKAVREDLSVQLDKLLKL